jgi:MFS family permease
MIASRENGTGRRSVQHVLVQAHASCRRRLCGLAGALFALYNVSVTPSLLSVGRTIDALAMTIIGGVGTLVGPILGAAIIQLLGYWLERWFGSSWTLIYGIIFMLIVIFLPTVSRHSAPALCSARGLAALATATPRLIAGGRLGGRESARSPAPSY